MADWDGAPLVFRDALERAFWGRAYLRARALSDDEAARTADAAVVRMRVRQPNIGRLSAEGEMIFDVCPVCSGAPDHHAGCPGDER